MPQDEALLVEAIKRLDQQLADAMRVRNAATGEAREVAEAEVQSLRAQQDDRKAELTALRFEETRQRDMESKEKKEQRTKKKLRRRGGATQQATGDQGAWTLHDAHQEGEWDDADAWSMARDREEDDDRQEKRLAAEVADQVARRKLEQEYKQEEAARAKRLQQRALEEQARLKQVKDEKALERQLASLERAEKEKVEKERRRMAALTKKASDVQEQPSLVKRMSLGWKAIWSSFIGKELPKDEDKAE